MRLGDEDRVTVRGAERVGQGSEVVGSVGLGLRSVRTDDYRVPDVQRGSLEPERAVIVEEHLARDRIVDIAEIGPHGRDTTPWR